MCPPGRLACPGDFSPWCVSPAGKTDPVHHRTLQRREEGDCGEPLPVSRAASTGREGERHPRRTWPSHRAADAALGRLSWGCEGLGWGGTSSAGSHGCPRERSSQNTGQGVGQINILRAQGQRKRFIETTRPHIPRKQKKKKRIHPGLLSVSFAEMPERQQSRRRGGTWAPLCISWFILLPSTCLLSEHSGSGALSSQSSLPALPAEPPFQQPPLSTCTGETCRWRLEEGPSCEKEIVCTVR